MSDTGSVSRRCPRPDVMQVQFNMPEDYRKPRGLRWAPDVECAEECRGSQHACLESFQVTLEALKVVRACTARP